MVRAHEGAEGGGVVNDWTNANPADYLVDEPLAAALVSYYRKRPGSIVDLGCGNGWYVRYLRDAGFDVAGYDANPHTSQMSGGVCHLADLSKTVWLGVWDYALSLEVGEHIQPEREQTFIDNIHYHNLCGAVVSWAVPGQTGIGHVNERPNEYIISEFTRRGYEYNAAESARLREAASLPWFRNTIMVFERPSCNTFTDARTVAVSA